MAGFWIWAGAARGGEPNGAKSQSGDKPYAEAFQGKVVCVLKRNVHMHLKGTVQQLRVVVGQRVKQGEVLATYRMSSEMVMGVKKRIAAPQIRELEQSLLEAERGLKTLHDKQHELQQLAAHNLAPAQGLKQVERDIQLAERQRATIQEKLKMEREAVQRDLDLLREHMGGSFKAAQTGEPVQIVAPVAGHVLWINPEFRPEAELPPGVHAFVIGVMEPMLMRAQVFEQDAVKIAVGDQAEVVFESLPGKVFDAKVSRLSWTPITPALEQPTYYELELTVPNKDLLLREGMKGEATLRKVDGR